MTVNQDLARLGPHARLVVLAQATQGSAARQDLMDALAAIAPYAGGDNAQADALAAHVLAKIAAPAGGYAALAEIALAGGLRGAGVSLAGSRGSSPGCLTTASQCYLRPAEFWDLIDCPLSQEQWEDLIRRRGADGRNPSIGH